MVKPPIVPLLPSTVIELSPPTVKLSPVNAESPTPTTFVSI
ncbi:hypothetical protein COI_0189 [Mannheimia haemolytica serotype A2 str. OVINE]|nr:hypothetical protein COI_0189 [Mannheimia haemolytica serotype A2 str. OVINE]EEY11546.1 hypothetical protein COK_2380 [Mannheimia haemolytica serotype A2 str. BOVINE]